MNNVKHGVLLELLIVISASLVSIASLENTIYGGKGTMNENVHSLRLLL